MFENFVFFEDPNTQQRGVLRLITQANRGAQMQSPFVAQWLQKAGHLMQHRGVPHPASGFGRLLPFVWCVVVAPTANVLQRSTGSPKSSAQGDPMQITIDVSRSVGFLGQVDTGCELLGPTPAPRGGCHQLTTQTPPVRGC